MGSLAEQLAKPFPVRTRRTRRVVLLLRRKFDAQHGTISAYVKGCACEPCRRANARVQRQKRGGVYA